MNGNFKERLSHIKCFVFDVDGVLTDGSLHIMPDGTMLRKMNIKDGYAIELAAKKGYFVFVISGSTPPGLAERLGRLGVDEVYIGEKNKLERLNNLLIKHQISLSNVLYMGDDMPDIEVMKKCAIASCPADAVHQVKEICIYVSEKKGGEGCVRDVIEQVLTLNNDWQ